MRKRRWISAAVLLILLGVGGFAYWYDLFPLPEVEDGDFPLRPVAVSDVLEPRWGTPFLHSSQTAWWRNGEHKPVIWVAKDTDWKTEPYPQVKAYPKLKSAHPLYGAIDFSKWRIDPDKPSVYFFVVDESLGTGKGYDRLYFDLDHDGDLTNDPPTTPSEAPTSPSQQGDEKIVSVDFPPLAIPFDFGPDDGTLPVEIFPSLSMHGEERQMFFKVTEAREGTIRMGRHRFHAVVSRSEPIVGRYDAPSTQLHLTTTGFYRDMLWNRWWCDEWISSMQLIDGKFYSLSVTPTGDLLKVRRYRGDLGVLRIDPGNRQFTDAYMMGSLASKTVASVPVGRLAHPYDGGLWHVQECELPVGDYLANKMEVRYGRLWFWLSDNYHTDGKRHGADFDSRVYAIKIRKDRPFVLDFSNRPEVMFADPAKDKTFKLGEKVQVNAVLVDPVLNTMIRGLNDTSRKTTRKNGDQTNTIDLPLEPTVTITNSSGKKVAEGVMPFG